MSERKTRKLGFYEIGRGKFRRQLQSYFEQAQVISNERNVPVQIRALIKVYPIREENIGSVETAVQIVEPPVKSIKYDAEYDKGVIVATGDSVAQLLQEELQLPSMEDDGKTVPFSHTKEA